MRIQSIGLAVKVQQARAVILHQGRVVGVQRARVSLGREGHVRASLTSLNVTRIETEVDGARALLPSLGDALAVEDILRAKGEAQGRLRPRRAPTRAIDVTNNMFFPTLLLRGIRDEAVVAQKLLVVRMVLLRGAGRGTRVVEEVCEGQGRRPTQRHILWLKWVCLA